jgi:hypothetical protein
MSTGVQGKAAVESLSGHVFINGGKRFFKNGYFYGKVFPAMSFICLKPHRLTFGTAFSLFSALTSAIPLLYSISVQITSE